MYIGFILLIVLVVLVVAAVQYVDYSKYEKSNYKKETGNTYFKVRFDAGFYGEYLTFNILDRVNGNKKILTNVYVPKETGGTTEIDVVMIHEKGIYVMESKNYSGWIYGDEKNKNWTQTFKSGKKEKFYNPIWQNQTHIKHLIKLLNMENSNMFRSIIVFSERCELKKVQVTSPDIKVINRYRLLRTLNTLTSESKLCLDVNEINKIYGRLKGYTNVSEEVKKQHIENVISYKK
ncbi:nuclease-related domain-containing protein [Clostridium sp.]|uniref:nuclease-related domain-containing protein n=1 Tax=Clostridium sp. TaxID=1506 RepID=UPI002FC9C60C